MGSLSKSHSQNFITSITHGIKAQMAHAKAVNRKKNWDDDDPENSASGVNTPITDYDHGDDSNQSGSSGTASGTGDRNTSGGTSSEIEIVFKLHPNMLQES